MISEIMQRKSSSSFRPLNESDIKDLDSNIRNLMSQAESKTRSNEQIKINLESLSRQNQINSGMTLSFTKEAIAQAISVNVQRSPLTHSLVKRRALAMDYKQAKRFSNLSDSKVGVYSIKSYTYNTIIEIPVRGANCTHYDVVDLEYLIREVAAKGWHCPLCNKKIQLATLCIDKQLEEELMKIAKLPDVHKPDLVFYEKENNKFVRSSYRKINFDEISSEPLNNYLLEPSRTSMYEVSNLWISPDKSHFEIFIEVLKAESDTKDNKGIIIVPVIILGDRVGVHNIKTQLVSQEFSSTEVRYLVYVPTAHNFEYHTQIAIIKSVLASNSTVKVVTLADGICVKEFKRYFNEFKAGFVMYKGKEVKVDKEEFKTNLVDIDDAAKMADDLRTRVENFATSNKKLIENNDSFLDQIQKAFNENFGFYQGEAKKVGPIVGNSGLILRFEIDLSNDFLYTYPFIKVLKINKDKDNDLYKIKVSGAAIKPFTDDKALKIYFPGKIAKSHFNGHSTSDLIKITGPQVDSYKDVILPMLLADFTAVYYDGSEGNVIECIIKAKETYPELNSKIVIIQGNEKINNLIIGKSIEEEKESTIRPLINKEDVISISDSKHFYFCWKYNIFLKIMEKAPDNVNNFFYTLKSDIKGLDLNEDSVIAKEEKKEEKTSLSITLKQAIAGKLSALGTKLLSITKDERTVEEIIFTVTVAHD